MRLWLLLVFLVLASSGFAQTSVKFLFDKNSPRQAYAISRLEKALKGRGYLGKDDGDVPIELILSNELPRESFSITPTRKKIFKITIAGGDENGLLYGCLSLAENIRNGMSLQNVRLVSETPKLPFRAIKYDLPWDTYRHSFSLDQHQQTCADIKYWETFLDMLAENRFNVLSLWNLHPYTFMIKPANFPEASPWNDAEMKKWKDLFGGIFRMAKERGIETYIIPFNIFVTPQFAKAHKVALDNLEHHFFVKGDTSEIVKRYTRECVTQLLDEYPDLTGMGLTLGEGMGGMTPDQREAWMQETIIAGMGKAKRLSKLIHRIPFSSTTGSLGPTSLETELLTRKGIEKEAAMGFVEAPVWADLKFNWSHPYGTTKLIKVHGGKLFGSYFDPVPTRYKVTWTARNEDFFCLRWGVPGFVRNHILANSQAYVGGYFIGSETYIPAFDYFSKTGSKRDWTYAFERQWLFYKLWGRLLYNPDTPDEIFKQEFIKKYGHEANPLMEASSLAGSTLLFLTSSFDIGWDFTLYGEGFMALNPQNKRVEYINVDRQINQPPLDPDYVSIAEYVKTISSGGSYAIERTTPDKLARMLDQDCGKAIALLKNVNTGGNPGFEQEIADIRVWANLGLSFSEKIKGGVALQTFRINGGEENRKAAITHLENALHYWDAVIAITKPLYREMPLVHFSEQDGKTWKENDNLRFHWEKLRPDVARDIEVAKNAVANK